MKTIVLRQTAISSFLLISATAGAAVITVPGFTGGPGYNETQLLGTTITNDSAVYMVGTVEVADPAAWNSSFNEAALSTAAGRPTAFGNNFGGQNMGIVRNGGGFQDSGTDFAAATPVTFTLKVDQLTGNQWLWINPNFFAFEDIGSADTTVGAAFSSSGGQPVLGSALDRIVFRGGDFAAPSTTVSYTNFSVYFGGSSPFIPEPSTALLAGLGSLLLLRRKRS